MQPTKRSQKKSRRRTPKETCPICTTYCIDCKKPCIPLDSIREGCKLCKQPCTICEPGCTLCEHPCLGGKRVCKCNVSCDFCMPDCTKCEKPCYHFRVCCNLQCINCASELPGQQNSDCMQCIIGRFRGKMRKRFGQWTSGNQQIDKIIQDSQLMARCNAVDGWTYLEWIDPERLADIKHIANGGFGSVYSATWLDCIYEYSKSGTRKRPQKVALKTLNFQDKTSGKCL